MQTIKISGFFEKLGIDQICFVEGEEPMQKKFCRLFRFLLAKKVKNISILESISRYSDLERFGEKN